MRVDHLTWPEYEEFISSRVVVLPIGSIDGHGPHLPLSTDTIISMYLAQEIEKSLDALVLPTIPYGLKTDPPASGGEFAGVTNIRASTLTNLVLDVLRASYRQGARRFLIIDCHKVNIGAVREALDILMESGPDCRVMAVTWWDMVSEDTRNAISKETGVRREDDRHAAMVETSLVMHIAPDSVRLDLLGDDEPARRARYLIYPVPDSLKTRGGVVYRAGLSSGSIGERVLAEVVPNLIAATKLELMS